MSDNEQQQSEEQKQSEDIEYQQPCVEEAQYVEETQQQQEEDLKQQEAELEDLENNQNHPQIDHQQHQQPVAEQIVQNYEFQQEIDIVVQDPQTKESNLNKVTFYVVKGKDQKGAFAVHRRFTEFYAVMEAMIIRWPGCYIPRLPSKKLIQGSEKKVIETRLKFLNIFVQKIAKLPHLFYSTEFNQIFIRSKDQDIIKIFSGVTKYSHNELIHKYNVIFPNLPQLQENPEAKIQEFYEHLQQSKEMLKKYKNFLKDSVENQEQLNQALTKTFCATLQDYEKQVVSQFVENDEDLLIFSHPFNKEAFEQRFRVSELFKKNNLPIFLDLIRIEAKECKAHHQQILALKEYEKIKTNLEAKCKEVQLEYQNAVQGKSSFKSMFYKGSHEDYKTKLQQQQNEVNSSIDQTKSIIVQDIEAFVTNKQTMYKQIIRTMADFELGALSQQLEYWEFIRNKSAALLNR